MAATKGEATKLVNPDLQRERNQATFNREELTHIFDGDKETTERRRYIEDLVYSDEELMRSPDYSFMSVEEKYSEGVRKACLIVKRMRQHNLNNYMDAFLFRCAAFPNEASPLNLQLDMFAPTLESQTTEAQREQWCTKAVNHEILGTYAQTELGHGTHLRGLETTATYDPKTDEFDLHSPTLTSWKWWPGGLGLTTNHALVVAQLYTEGRCHGPHVFMVQTRCLDTHVPLKGITLGDIGPTFGFEAIDNGFVKFDHVRIPRTDMLMKHAQVERGGRYVSRLSSKLQYGAMLFVRATLLNSVVAGALARAVTIAVRYSAVRRQSELQRGAPEPQVLDFVTQQLKLLPLVAEAWAVTFIGHYLRELYFESMYEINQGNVGILAQLHSLSSGLKAFCTDSMRFGVETCRLSCGGHGYSHASGLPKIYIHSVAACTYEGENTVMYLQCGSALLKARRQHLAGEPVVGHMSYLAEGATVPLAGRDITFDRLVDVYRSRSTWVVRRADLQYTSLLQSGMPEHDARNQVGSLLVDAAKAHCHYFIVKTFVEKVCGLSCSPEVAAVLKLLCELYALVGVTANAGEFIQGAGVTSAQLDALSLRTVALLAAVRPVAVGVVDAFDFSDHSLGSVLGRWDGRVYEHLVEWALRSPLNKSQVHESYYKYIRPMMTKSKL